MESALWLSEVASVTGADGPDRDAALGRLWLKFPGALCFMEIKDIGSSRFVFVSDSASALFGLAPTELYRDAELFSCRVSPEDLAGLGSAMDLARQSGRRKMVRFRYLHPDGRLRKFESAGVVAHAGSQTYLFTWVLDVTESPDADPRFNRRRSDLDTGRDPVLCCRQDGSLAYINTAARTLLGFSANSMETIPWKQFAHECLRMDWAQVWSRSLHEDAVFFSAKNHLENGQVLDVEGWINHGSMDGEDMLWIVLRDVSERNRIEERLRLYAKVFECSHSATVVIDRSQVVLDVNPAFVRLTGYSREEIIGHSITKLMDVGRRSLALAQMLKGVQDAGEWHGETEFVDKQGVTRKLLMTVSALHGDSQQISHYVAASSDITKLKEQQARLERMALYDSLTSLPNRVLFAARLHQAMARSRRLGTLLAVCYLDVDGFKPINDLHGHSTGDALLVEVAGRLKAAVNRSDTIARLGGDEFALLITGLSDTQPDTELFERLLDAVASPIIVDGVSFSMTASIGATLFPADDADADTLLRHADEAMYQAKRAGRSRYSLFDAKMEHTAIARRSLRHEFELALRSGDLRLHYEPKVNLRQGRVIGAEALVRWQHPKRDLLLPREFLPSIEDTDLMIELGEWVIAEVRRQLEAWDEIGLCLPVSLNLALRQLQQPGFPQRLDQLLGKFLREHPNRIELEIVETAALSDIDGLAETMAACRSVGVSFALDDFGTGYSTLNWLRYLPADTLKIDVGFVAGVLTNAADRALVRGLVGLAFSFDRCIIAEGVATAEHGRALLQLGCECGQGYGLAKPMSPELFPTWVAGFDQSNSWRQKTSSATRKRRHVPDPSLG